MISMRLPSEQSKKLKVLAIMGPTATGKSELAVNIAQQLDCEIISVDSAMVYRGMDIGTAKPTERERKGVPHHLIDILAPTEIYSTGKFCEQSLELVKSILERGRTPLFAGGTMLYYNALFHGISALPKADADIRTEINDEANIYGWQQMHRRLEEFDPISAKRIHPNDPQRIQRAHEVFRISGVPLSTLQAQKSGKLSAFDIVKCIVWPKDRNWLHQRIQQRFLEMIDNGLIDEVKNLKKHTDLHEGLPSIRSVGYRQVWQYLCERIDRSTMIDRGIVATRQLAKRQMTWLRKEVNAIQWDAQDPLLESKILKTFMGAIE